jgi:UDP-glucuronate 4-epimerase
MKHCLLTGGAGFIGSHVADRLLADGWRITVIDNFDPFYPRNVKLSNIISHSTNKNYQLCEADIRSRGDLERLSDQHFDAIVHLAARAGVRPSIADPAGYQDVNVRGTQTMLDFARHAGVKQFVFASSSSVYGLNANVPWSERDACLLPISPYASTKLSAELLGHVYSHLYGLRFIALRFFTVYGPRQRPDLAIHKFAQSITAGRRIPVYGDGRTRRDYTYIADIVSGIQAALCYDRTLYEVINLGNNHTVSLTELIHSIETVTGRKALIETLPDQAGDVPQTWADISKASALLNYSPATGLIDGLTTFVSWLHTSQQDAVTLQSSEVSLQSLPAVG